MLPFFKQIDLLPRKSVLQHDNVRHDDTSNFERLEKVGEFYSSPKESEAPDKAYGYRLPFYFVL